MNAFIVILALAVSSASAGNLVGGLVAPVGLVGPTAVSYAGVNRVISPAVLGVRTVGLAAPLGLGYGGLGYGGLGYAGYAGLGGLGYAGLGVAPLGVRTLGYGGLVSPLGYGLAAKGGLIL